MAKMYFEAGSTSGASFIPRQVGKTAMMAVDVFEQASELEAAEPSPLWTFNGLTMSANKDGDRKVKVKLRFDATAEQIRAYPGGRSAAAICEAQAEAVENDEPAGPDRWTYGQRCAGRLTFGTLEREAMTTEIHLTATIRDAVCMVDATFVLHNADDGAWLMLQGGKALDVEWVAFQGALL